MIKVTILQKQKKRLRGANSKKVNTHPKIPEIDLDFFKLLLTFIKIIQILS